ncbi:hypothetical protein [Teichococcus vastitatis]|uniref:Uncharacterized protein n=1 Tax=Teichococcus vastitatis TaxID=2307076 RepID=A0ABS9WCE9_9PROT|nr:hypothetical protein [Pseudoroseomonas vastitatis]MCI0756926.1 hypothetical protein [Pseudoroseomonas vastitatis]
MLGYLILLAGLLLAPPGQALPGPAAALPGCGTATLLHPADPAAAEPHRQACRQGRDMAALGWRLIGYGVDTLKYGIGLVLILLGAMLVGIGWAVSLVEALFC